ncbi:hypothetical protein D3C86_1541790 [compost metagenome]
MRPVPGAWRPSAGRGSWSRRCRSKSSAMVCTCGAGSVCRPSTVARRICSISSSTVVPCATNWWLTRCARRIAMCCSTAGTRLSCCFLKSIRPASTSTCTRPSTKCASAKGAWSTISFTARCTVLWAMCGRTIIWRHRWRQRSSGPPVWMPVNSAPRAKCAWRPMRCWNSHRLSLHSIRLPVQALAPAISINTRHARSPLCR